MLYVVSYSLQPKRDSTPILEELQKSPNWCHFIDETWLVATTETPEQLAARLYPRFLKTDRILIIQFTSFAAYYGWLPPEAWNWINANRNA